ncbi:MAG: Hint domain-containing protein [Roseovarius sp.]
MLGWMSADTWGTDSTVETTSAYNGGTVGARSGLITGTRVATGLGWRKVEALGEGDMVLTFDAGLQRITKITREVIWNEARACPQRFWPLNVPAGALGNRDALTILPDQYVMVESDAGEDLFGDPFSLIPASALVGVNGIAAVPAQHGLEAIVLHFENDQVVFAETGVLYYCPSACGLLDRVVATHSTAPYVALTQEDADVLVMCIENERGQDRIWAGADMPSCAVA